MVIIHSWLRILQKEMRYLVHVRYLWFLPFFDILPCKYSWRALSWSWIHIYTIRMKTKPSPQSIFLCRTRGRSQRSRYNDMVGLTAPPRHCSDICDKLVDLMTNLCHRHSHRWRPVCSTHRSASEMKPYVHQDVIQSFRKSSESLLKAVWRLSVLCSQWYRAVVFRPWGLLTSRSHPLCKLQTRWPDQNWKLLGNSEFKQSLEILIQTSYGLWDVQFTNSTVCLEKGDSLKFKLPNLALWPIRLVFQGKNYGSNWKWLEFR